MATSAENLSVSVQDQDDQLGILQRRRIEANIISPIYQIMKRELGQERASDIIREAITEDAHKAGARFAANEPNGANLLTFIAIQDLWKKDDALVTEVIEESEEVYTYEVKRCAYAEMYQEMGLAEIGNLLSCTRDFEFIVGYDPTIEITRTKTIMGGDSHCDFHYVRKSSGMTTPQINSARLWKSLDEVSVFGATPAGGLHRLAASKEDGQARDYVVAAARELGCTVRIDALGNTFMRRAGTDSNAKAILIGSHLDSQPLGGKYDGIYGVMAGLELLRVLHETKTETKHAIEVAVWTNEEGARFAPAMMGAAYFAGKFTADELLSRKDVDGIELGKSLTEIGYAGTDSVSPVEHKAYFEIHIEQGPILQDENFQIGVVTLVQGMRWFRVGISGQAGHTGTYPMETRRDALVAASHLIKAVQQIGLDQPLTGRATVGHIVVTPNSPNVIPGHVEMMVEFRNPEVAVLDVMTTSLNQSLKELETKFRVEVVSKQELDSATIDFTPELIEIVEQAAAASGKTSKRMISGAGHDACQLSAVMPTTMIFIPCDKGISHAEDEAITQEWAADGAQVLVETVLAFNSK